MLIKKYPQSCVFIETDSKKILVDPGQLNYSEEFLDEWKEADMVLVTHKHFDHIHPDVLKKLKIPIYSSKEVADAYPELEINVVARGDALNFYNLKVEVTKAVHGYIPPFKDGGEVLENIGFIIDDGNTRVYATSDTICFRNDYKADVVLLPVTAHGLTMSPFEGALFVQELGAKLVLPIHMDNPKYPTDIVYMRDMFDKEGLKYKVLEVGDVVEV